MLDVLERAAIVEDRVSWQDGDGVVHYRTDYDDPLVGLSVGPDRRGFNYFPCSERYGNFTLYKRVALPTTCLRCLADPEGTE